MSASINLFDVNDAVEKEYGDFTVNVAGRDQDEDLAHFRYYLRAPRADRAKLAEAFARLREHNNLEAEGTIADEDGITAITNVVKDAFAALAVKTEDFTKVEKLAGEDLPTWAILIKGYAAKYRQAGAPIDEDLSGEA